jgi:putative endonuclease
MDKKSFYVYILTNFNNKVCYTGITSDLIKRVYQHKHKLVEGFTFKYNVNKLVYYEEFDDPNVAIAREKQIKGWNRNKKNKLVETKNPYWKDLSEELNFFGFM